MTVKKTISSETPSSIILQPRFDVLDDETEVKLGQGRTPFTRMHKRLCGFVFLRTLRTGSRALSLQRGSLLDSVLKLGGAGAVEMWQDTLNRLQNLDPAIGEIEQLKNIRAEVRARMGRFVNLAAGDDATAFFASELRASISARSFGSSSLLSRANISCRLDGLAPARSTCSSSHC